MRDRGEDRLPARAQALLEAWPLSEPEEDRWDDLADAVLSKLRRVQPTGTPDELLAPPLPPARGEGISEELLREAPSMAVRDSAGVSASSRTAPSSPRAAAPQPVPSSPRAAAAPPPAPSSSPRAAPSSPQAAPGARPPPPSHTSSPRPDRPHESRPSQDPPAERHAAAPERAHSARPAMRLTDLAKASVPPQEHPDNLAMVRQSLTYADRARHAGAIARQVAEAATPSDAPRAEAVTGAAEDLPRERWAQAVPASQPVQAVAARQPNQSPVRQASRASLIGGTLVGLMGLAAGVFLYLRATPHPPDADERPNKDATQAAASAAVPDQVQPARKSVAEAPKTREPDEVVASGQQPPAAQAPRMATGTGPRIPGRQAVSRRDAKPSDKPEEPPAATPPPPSSEPTQAVAAKQPEAESYPDRLPPAHDDSRPLEPSMGAVSAAIMAVRPAAQACLAGQSVNAPATIIFGSEGQVKSVIVSGPVARTPAGDCIRSALSRAKVSPFAKATFSVPTTVRPP
jgi:hypothetical protein